MDLLQIENMVNKKLIIGIIAFIIFITVIFSLMVVKPRRESSYLSPTPTPESWKVYDKSEFFSRIEYPPSWVYQDMTLVNKNNKLALVFFPEGYPDEVIGLRIFDAYSHATADSWIEEFVTVKEQSELERWEPPKYILYGVKETVKLPDSEKFLLKINQYKEGLLFLKGNYIYLFTHKEGEAETIFNQIIASFS